MQNTQTRIKIFSIFALFALSGFSGLIYESVWTHYIKLILGHAAYAQTLVLATFMGGLALGAWLVSRKPAFFLRPLVWYIVIEFILGVFGLLFHYEFLLASTLLFDHLLPATASPVTAGILKWLVSFIILMPQAVLLGTTFPLIGAAIIRLQQTRPGETLSMLYFSNSIGAVAGILVSGFVLIEVVGLPGTTLSAGIINIMLAVVLWIISGGYQGEINRPHQPVAMSTSGKESASQQSFARLLLVVALLTGLSSFFYEIAWIRMLSLVLGSSMQAFELMLSAFILGLALGGLFIRKRADHLKQPVYVLGWIQMAMGLLAITTLPVYAASFDTMAFLFSSLGRTDGGYTLFNISSHAIAIAIMVPATFMAGMTLPLITTILLARGNGEQSIGRVYAANTVGAIVGIVIAINVLMPVIGATNLVVFGGLIDIAVGIYLVYTIIGDRIKAPGHAVAISALLVLGIALSFTRFDDNMLASGVFRFGQARLPQHASPAFHKDGRTATVSFIKYPNGSRSIRTNGKSDAMVNDLEQGPSGDESTMTMFSTLPILYKPDLEYVGNIGLGSGFSVSLLLKSDSIKRIDTIEIEKQILNGARLFGERVSSTFSDPRSNIVIDDAKSFFSSRQQKYDAIISEPSNPWISGVSSLFTAEYYQQIKRHLKQDGFFVQWLQLYEINMNGVGSVLKAIDSEFRYYKVYSSDDGNLIILASDSNKLEQTHDDLFSIDALRPDLQRVGLNNKTEYSNRLIGDKKLLSGLVHSISAPLNSDFFPYLSYAAPQSRFKQENAMVMSRLHISSVPVTRWLNHKSVPADSVTRGGTNLAFYSARRTALDVVEFKTGAIDNPNLRWAISRLHGPDFRCDASATGYHDDIEALAVVGGSINPFLDNQSLASFWRSIGRRCLSKPASNNAATFWRLQQAISQQDNEKTLQLTERLLTPGRTMPKSILDHILLARLTAAYDSGNRQAGIVTVIQFQLAARLPDLDLPMQLVVNAILASSKSE